MGYRDNENESDEEFCDFVSGYNVTRMGGMPLSTGVEKRLERLEIKREREEYKKIMNEREEIEADSKTKIDSENDSIYGVINRSKVLQDEAEKTLAGKSARDLEKKGMGSRIVEWFKHLFHKEHNNGMER